MAAKILERARMQRCGAWSREGALRPSGCPSGWWGHVPGHGTGLCAGLWRGDAGPKLSPSPCLDLSKAQAGTGPSLMPGAA